MLGEMHLRGNSRNNRSSTLHVLRRYHAQDRWIKGREFHRIQHVTGRIRLIYRFYIAMVLSYRI